jgi:hypothetical protein
MLVEPTKFQLGKSKKDSSYDRFRLKSEQQIVIQTLYLELESPPFMIFLKKLNLLGHLTNVHLEKCSQSRRTSALSGVELVALDHIYYIPIQTNA